jgi:hypothetical protein
MTALKRAKLKAFAIHLCLSAAIFLPFLYLLLYQWFPGPLFTLDGGWQGLRLMLLCDMVIGPVLTLATYDPAKTWRAKAFDYSFIGLCQLGSLLYGVYAVDLKKPVVLSMDGTKLIAVNRIAYDMQGIKPEQWQQFDTEHPRVVWNRSTLDNPQSIATLRQWAAKGLDAYQVFEFHENIKPKLDVLRTFSQPPKGADPKLIWLKVVGSHRTGMIGFDDNLRMVDFRAGKNYE